MHKHKYKFEHPFRYNTMLFFGCTGCGSYVAISRVDYLRMLAPKAPDLCIKLVHRHGSDKTIHRCMKPARHEGAHRCECGVLAR